MKIPTTTIHLIQTRWLVVHLLFDIAENAQERGGSRPPRPERGPYEMPVSVTCNAVTWGGSRRNFISVEARQLLYLNYQDQCKIFL